MNTLLKKKIMRRIYTAYAMRILGGTRARHMMVMTLCAIGFVQYVSILDVAHNFSTVTVGGVWQFVVGAVSQTEVWTLVMLGIFAYALYAFWKGDIVSSEGLGVHSKRMA